jgi:hypothetical protein
MGISSLPGLLGGVRSPLPTNSHRRGVFADGCQNNERRSSRSVRIRRMYDLGLRQSPVRMSDAIIDIHQHLHAVRRRKMDPV